MSAPETAPVALWRAAVAIADALVGNQDLLDATAWPEPEEHDLPTPQRVVLAAVLLHTAASTTAPSAGVSELAALPLAELCQMAATTSPSELAHALTQRQPGAAEAGYQECLDLAARTDTPAATPFSTAKTELLEPIVELLESHRSAAAAAPGRAADAGEPVLGERFPMLTSPLLQPRRCFPELADALGPAAAGASPGWSAPRRTLWRQAGTHAQALRSRLELAACRLPERNVDLTSRWITAAQLLTYLYRVQDPHRRWPTVSQLRALDLSLQDRPPGATMREYAALALPALGHPLDGSAETSDEAARAFAIVDHQFRRRYFPGGSIWSWLVSCTEAILFAERGGHTRESRVEVQAGDLAGLQVSVLAVGWAPDATGADLQPGPPAIYQVTTILRPQVVPAAELPAAPPERDLWWKQALWAATGWASPHNQDTPRWEGHILAVLAYLHARRTPPPDAVPVAQWLRTYGSRAHPITALAALYPGIGQPGWGPWLELPPPAEPQRSIRHHDEALGAEMLTGLAELGHDLADLTDPFVLAVQEYLAAPAGVRETAWTWCTAAAQREWQIATELHQQDQPAVVVAADLALGLTVSHLERTQVPVTAKTLQPWWPAVALLTTTLYGVAWRHRVHTLDQLALPVVMRALTDPASARQLATLRPIAEPGNGEASLPPMLEEALTAEPQSALIEQAIAQARAVLDTALAKGLASHADDPRDRIGPPWPVLRRLHLHHHASTKIRHCWIQHPELSPLLNKYEHS